MKKFKLWLLSNIVYVLYKMWVLTLRYEEVGREEIDRLFAARQPLIFCLWHENIFSILRVRRQLKVAAFASLSRDGDFASKILHKLGFGTLRGSSSRGGAVALRQALRRMREEQYIPCATVDGPRGPRHSVKSGVFFLAAYADALLVPVTTVCSKAKRLNSWDKHKLPLPFSRVRVIFGVPYKLTNQELSEAELNRQKMLLAEKLQQLEAEHVFS